MLTLGFDTSNYTTSVAAFDGVGGKNCSRLLDVKPGELGLRQSDALFAHVKRLPELVDALCASVNIEHVTAVGVSTRPRAVDQLTGGDIARAAELFGPDSFAVRGHKQQLRRSAGQMPRKMRRLHQLQPSG